MLSFKPGTIIGCRVISQSKAKIYHRLYRYQDDETMIKSINHYLPTNVLFYMSFKEWRFLEVGSLNCFVMTPSH